MARRQLLVVPPVVLAVLVVLAIPASAEGSWTSYLSNVRVGFETRRWWDNHNDAAGTMAGIYACRDQAPDPSDSIGLELRRHVPGWFDESKGTREGTCYNLVYLYWGEMKDPGEYWFKVSDISNCADHGGCYLYSISTRYPDGFMVSY